MQEHWTARFSRPIIFVIVALIAMGSYLAFTIPVAVFPSTDFPRIVVGVDNGVSPIDQMQVMVTRPIEEAMNTVPGLETVRSITSRGAADISLFFNWNVDMFRTLQFVNAALARVQPTLPPTAKLVANRLTFAVFPIMGYSLTSDSIPQRTLWEMANYTIKPRLNRVTGVSMVVLQGGQVPEFHIEPDPAKLLQAQVSVPTILDAVAKSNIIDSPGLFGNNHELALALVTGQARTTEEIGEIVVKTSAAGVPIRIADLATVKPGAMPVYTIVTANGKPAVLLNVFRQPDSNTVAVSDQVVDEIAQIKSSLPPGVKLQPFYDQSEVVRDSISAVRDATLIGLVLAAAILVLFLRDWGSSIVAGLVIPATIAVTLIILRALNQSFDLMTLGGLAAAVGLIIDDAIVVVENIVLHRDTGETRGEAVRKALAEIRVPLVGSTIAPIVVFLPLVSITGVTGTFFRALAITVGGALLTSLALALTWTPTLSHYLLSGKTKPHTSDSDSVMRRLTTFYQAVLRYTLAKPFVLAVSSLALVGLSWFCFNTLGSDLLPEIDEGSFILDYLMPAGSSLEDTNTVLLGVEKILAEIPEVDSLSRRTGLQLGLAAVTEANRGDFAVHLKRNRDRGMDEVISEARKKVNEAYPQLDVEFIQLLQDMIGDLSNAPEPINIKLFAQDPAILREWAPKIGDRIRRIPTVKDVKDGIENTITGPAVIMKVNTVAAARTGFTPQEIEVNAAAILQGEPATTQVVVNDRSYGIRVRFPDRVRADLDEIRNTMIVSSTGRNATLGTLATFENEAGQTEIQRENLQRNVAVTGWFEGISLGKGIDQVKEAVSGMKLPPEIRVVYSGVYAEQQRSFRDLIFVLILAIVLVFVVLLFEFRSFSAPVAILASALLSTSGVFVALLVTGETFNISSFMGLIMVIGIVAKNGILLLDADQKYRAEGGSPLDAMLHAGERRLRPIIMTALATVAGMVPLALALGAGSQMLQPLAIAVIGGVAASMVLSLVVTPAVHYYMSEKTAPPTPALGVPRDSAALP